MFSISDLSHPVVVSDKQVDDPLRQANDLLFGRILERNLFPFE
jgi:hypothetical protein